MSKNPLSETWILLLDEVYRILDASTHHDLIATATHLKTTTPSIQIQADYIASLIHYPTVNLSSVLIGHIVDWSIASNHMDIIHAIHRKTLQFPSNPFALKLSLMCGFSVHDTMESYVDECRLATAELFDRLRHEKIPAEVESICYVIGSSLN
ncbi:hypothetical protein QVD99_002415 [Batrachochytrium dendrobatidis]|nr:hypothetical protein O5D80_006643 [Batrachochytrium dendrobatidis]KAK5670635.1 hypothetical protein QVD99_002415 [Batrachochytrium dendrobatidis]